MNIADYLRKVVKANGSQKETARVLCISPQYLCDILHGRREISADVAGLLGYERVVTYTEIRPSDPAVVATVDSRPQADHARENCSSCSSLLAHVEALSAEVKEKRAWTVSVRGAFP